MVEATYHVFSNDQTLNIIREGEKTPLSLAELRVKAKLKEQAIASYEHVDEESLYNTPRRNKGLRSLLCF